MNRLAYRRRFQLLPQSIREIFAMSKVERARVRKLGVANSLRFSGEKFAEEVEAIFIDENIL